MKLLFCYMLLITQVYPLNITFFKRNAVVWSQDQLINGRITDSEVTTNLVHNGNVIPFMTAADKSFSIPVKLYEGKNWILVEADSAGTKHFSDTLYLTLGYKLRPDVFIYPDVNGSNVTLHAQILDNPESDTLTFFWTADTNNPASLELNSYTDSISSFTVPSGSPMGEYYFNLYTYTSDGDTVKARTFITLDSTSIKPFDIKNDYAQWIDKAIIYEITPHIFVENGKFRFITRKLNEIKELGINTIWIQPIYGTHGGGMGYDVINYFGVRGDLGGETELTELITTAKAMGFRILFDFVANHSSINHAYARESSQYDTLSHYYDYYQRVEDNAPYSQHYKHYAGFINYFWNDLPNLNFENPEVRKWMLEAIKYWIEKYDIDGYRFDAIWGVNARRPEWTKELRLALKRIKPEILMLAEDKATWPMVFDERFDAAFDWAAGEEWVSQWVFQTTYSTSTNNTIFNNSESVRSSRLRNALTNYGQGYTSDAKILRFIENNDTYRFIQHHGLERTRMAASLIFALHGIPMIYNGQETGNEEHPYSSDGIYYTGGSIKSQDKFGLFPFYKRLTELRTILPSLNTNNYEEIKVTPAQYVFAFRRWSADQNVITLLNMGSSDQQAVINIPVDELNLDSSITYYLTDMITGDVFSGTAQQLGNISVPVPKYTTRMMLLADTIMTVVNVEQPKDQSPLSFNLAQNYPNPFNPATKIKYTIPEPGNVRLIIFDLLGKEVALLEDRYISSAGSYDIIFNGSNLSSGLYLYRLEYNNTAITKKMLILK